MTTLTIIDLPRVEIMHRDAMSTTRGGILTVTKPGSETGTQGLLPSWPGFAHVDSPHFPLSWPLSPQRPALDPRYQ